MDARIMIVGLAVLSACGSGTNPAVGEYAAYGVRDSCVRTRATETGSMDLDHSCDLSLSIVEAAGGGLDLTFTVPGDTSVDGVTCTAHLDGPGPEYTIATPACTLAYADLIGPRGCFPNATFGPMRVTLGAGEVPTASVAVTLTLGDAPIRDRCLTDEARMALSWSATLPRAATP